MAKEVVAQVKLQIPAGQANPAPPVGTALGPRGVNIMAFCKEFNAATQKQAGDILPVVNTVFKDKSFTFLTKSPPAALPLKYSHSCNAIGTLPFFQRKSWNARRLNLSPCCMRASARNFRICNFPI